MDAATWEAYVSTLSEPELIALVKDLDATRAALEASAGGKDALMVAE
jgi:hypothetical protein